MFSYDGSMKIILVATDTRGKNLVFVSDALRAYSLSEAVRLAQDGKLENIYPVHRGTGVYLRTKPGVPEPGHLEALTISSHQLFASLDGITYAVTTPALGNYLRLYKGAVVRDQPYIRVAKRPDVVKKFVKAKLQPHRNLVFAAAKKFNVDPYLLGAIIIDEIVRLIPFEEIADKLLVSFVGANTSAGIAQVEIDTARDLIERGYYNPNPDDSKLSSATIRKVSRSHLHLYVKKPKHSIFFAAARMRALIDEWRKFLDLGKKPEIIATLYHLKHKDPHARPKPNDRGLQITGEFYNLAQEWLQ